MYEKFYGFKENPFTITPDPKFFFPSPKHTEVLDSLIYTVTERRGFAVITGEIGSGKTTICRTLLERLNPGTKVAMITNTYLSPKELLSYTLEELGVTFDGREKSNLLSCLKKFLVEQLYLDFNVVLIIDEAQNLSLNVLEELRMLSNLETEKKKMIQIILTGQPALKDKLASKELEQLRQRINVQYHIPPLNRINNERYINHRLEVASINGNRKVEFTPQAIDKIYAHSQGIPRVINMICNNALLIGYVTEAAQITPQIIKEAIEEFQNEIKVDKPIVSLPQAKQSQLQEAETKLTQLNEQLNRLKKEKEEASKQLQSTQEELNRYHSEATKKQSDLEQTNKDLQKSQESLSTTQSLVSQKNSELKETETQLKQLNEQLKKGQEENSQLKLKQETLSSQLKVSLNLYESAIAGKQVELDRINKNLQSNQEALNTTQSSLSQREAELEAKQSQLQATETQLKQKNSELETTETQLKQLNEQLNSNQEKLATMQSQLQATETQLTQLNEQLNQLRKNEEEASKQLQSTQEELNRYHSEATKKQSDLEQANKDLQESQESLSTTQSSLSQREAELEAKQSQLQATETQLKQKNSELETTETQLKQLNEQLKKVQEENSQLKLKQEAVSSQLKASLNLYESTIAVKQSELDRINKSLESSQRDLSTTESKCQQKHSELEQITSQLGNAKKKFEDLEESILDQTQKLIAKLQSKGLQVKETENNLEQLNKELEQVKQQKQKLQVEEERLKQVHLEHQREYKIKEEEASRQFQETEFKLKQLNEELNQLRKDKEKTQVEQAKLNQEWLKCQREWKQKQEELRQYESTVAQKQSELKELNHNIAQLKGELKNLQEEKVRYQRAQEKLNKIWSDHQGQWQQKEKEILEEFKFTPIIKTAEGESLKQPELEQVANIIDKPIIKLKPKKPKTNAAILAASHLRGEIKIDSIGNDDFLSSFYNGIRIFHRNGDIGNYKNFIFSAKGDKKRDYSTVFKVELNNNGSMKVGKHHSVRVTDSWQKFNIPLDDFSRMINLNIITEMAIFLDAITEADDITYIKDICFSNNNF